MTWWQALVQAGAVAAAYVPPHLPGGASADAEDSMGGATADLIEDSELQAHPVPIRGATTARPTASFLNGIERWSVRAYDGVIPLVDAYAAAAVRRRDGQGVLHTTFEHHRSFAVAPLERMTPTLRQVLEQSGVDVEPIEGAKYLEKVESTVRRVRSQLERDLAERCLDRLGSDEWLIVDGLLARSPAVARHPCALGVIKSHGAQFLEGRGLERALTLPAGNRTSVFAVRGGHTRMEVYSWYLRLWPWEGNDLLYGLLRVEARAHPDTVKRAGDLSGWLFSERAPLATPATRWDRLLYPLQQVEEYLKARAPGSLPARSRLPVAL